MFFETAKVQVKSTDGKTVVGEKEYQKPVFHGTGRDEKKNVAGGTPEELLSSALAFFQTQLTNDKGELTGNPVVEMLSHVTYAYDLGERNKIRQQIQAGLAGPEKALDKAFENFNKARAAVGKPPVTREAFDAVFGQ